MCVMCAFHRVRMQGTLCGAHTRGEALCQVLANGATRPRQQPTRLHAVLPCRQSGCTTGLPRRAQLPQTSTPRQGQQQQAHRHSESGCPASVLSVSGMETSSNV